MLPTLPASCSKDSDKKEDFVPGRFSVKFYNRINREIAYVITDAAGNFAVGNLLAPLGEIKLGNIFEPGQQYDISFSAPNESYPLLIDEVKGRLYSYPPKVMLEYVATNLTAEGYYISTHVLDLSRIKVTDYAHGDPLLDLDIEIYRE